MTGYLKSVKINQSITNYPFSLKNVKFCVKLNTTSSSEVNLKPASNSILNRGLWSFEVNIRKINL